LTAKEGGNLLYFTVVVVAQKVRQNMQMIGQAPAIRDSLVKSRLVIEDRNGGVAAGPDGTLKGGESVMLPPNYFWFRRGPLDCSADVLLRHIGMTAIGPECGGGCRRLENKTRTRAWQGYDVGHG